MPSSPVSADVIARAHALEDDPMFATEYDLLVAEDQLRSRRDEMKSIHAAQAIRAASTDRPSLLDRLVSLTRLGGHIQAPHRKAGAAA